MQTIEKILFIFWFYILIIICSVHMGKLIPLRSNDYEKIYYPKALLATKELTKDISLVVEDLNHISKAWCSVAKPKPKSSLLRKANFELLPIKTQSGRIVRDFEEINDLIRGTVILRDLNDAESVINMFKTKYGEPIMFLNRFENPLPNHFKFIKIIFQNTKKHYINRDQNLVENKNLDGKYYLNFELKIQICDIMQIKDNLHLLYEITRIISNINHENTYENILQKIGMTQKNYEKVFEKVNQKIRAFIPNYFIFYDKTFEAWNSDKNNKEKIKNFLDEIRSIEIKINDAVYLKYLREKKMNNSTCNLDDFYDNSNCSYLGNDMERILDAGGKFIHQLLE